MSHVGWAQPATTTWEIGVSPRAQGCAWLGRVGRGGICAGPCIPTSAGDIDSGDPEFVLLKERRSCGRQVGMGQT